MRFNKAKLYTLLDASELKIGSRGYFANDVVELADYLDDEPDFETLTEVKKDEGNGTKCFKSDKKEGWYRFFYFLGNSKLTETEKLGEKKETEKRWKTLEEQKSNSELLEKTRFSYIDRNCRTLYSVARILSHIDFLNEGMADVLAGVIEDTALTIQENCKIELEYDEDDLTEE